MSAPPNATGPGERGRIGHREKVLSLLLPGVVLLGALGIWEIIVAIFAIPPYVLPAPSLIAQTLWADWGTLSSSLWVTLRITFLALIAATLGAVGLAVLFARWKWIERSFFPFAVILQVTPIVATTL